MQILEIVSLISTAGAWLAAIAALLSVNEMGKQRRTMFRPELMLSRVSFVAKANAGSRLSSEWQYLGDPPQNALGELGLPLINIGLGAAKDIVVEWSFSVKELVQIIQQIAAESGISLKIEYIRGVVSIESVEFGSMGLLWQGSDQTKISYSLPASIQRERIILPVPLAYRYLVSLIVNLGMRTEKVRTEVPPLSVSLKFLDIAGDRRRASFLVNIRFFYWNTAENRFDAILEPAKS